MAVTTGTMMAMSTGLSVVGQLAQGMAQKRAADVEAQQADRQAAQVQDEALQEAERIRRAGKRTQGAARAQLAASGIRVDSGSALVIDEEIGMDSELDAQNILLTGKRRSDAAKFSASQSRAKGKNAMTGSALGAITTGLQGWKGVKAAEPARRKGHDTFAEGEY
jgi:hypothetical protein